jgi:uncharacterized membrane protein
MRPSNTNASREGAGSFLWDLLSFQRMLTGPVLHLVYWAGLGVIFILSCGMIAGAVTVAAREGAMGLLLGFAALMASLLAMAGLVLLWRMMCEFYVAVFRISEDLRALRQHNEAQAAAKTPPPSL